MSTPVLHFAQSNPTGLGQGDVPALLRRVANSIEELGDIVVLDITFHSETGEDEDDLTMVVYYDDRSRRKSTDD